MTVKSESRADRIKDGWKYDYPLGGNIGVDVKIPVVAGLYLKPGVGGLYMKDYCKKETTTERTVKLIDKIQGYHVTWKEYRTTHTWRSYERTDMISMMVPFTIGYSFSLGRIASVSVGATGFVSSLLKCVSTNNTYNTYLSFPMNAELDKDTHDKETVDVLKDVKFKDRLSYGIGGEAELALGAFFTRYSLRCPITESKKDYTLYHDLSVGVYF